MTTNFTFNNGGTVTNFEDVFIPRDAFSQGGLWLWGQNTNGQLGTNNTTNQSSPVQTIANGTNWKLISAGDSVCTGIKTDGTLWLWGSNFYGQLGTNDIVHRSSPVQTIAGGTNWKQVSVGYVFTTAIKTDGTLWVWGKNSYGQLGTNDIVHRSSPVQTIANGTNWKQVACSGVRFGYTTTAIKTDGTLWTWGYNNNGQLGTNDIVHRSSPVQTVAGGTNWKQISAGGYHAAAIKTDGTLWVWGINSSGQLGTNDIVHRSSPVQTIAGGTNWKQVSGGYQHTTAIKTDGTLWNWGQNIFGQLGTNNTTIVSSPVQTIAGGTNWKEVANGSDYTASIKTDGTLWVWGKNSYGQLGTNDKVHRSSPVQTIAGGTNWKLVTGGDYYISANREDFY